MEIPARYNNYRIVILALSVALFLIGAYFHSIDNFSLYRCVRGCIPIIFLILLVYYHGKEVYQPIFLFLLFYGASSLATIWYEIDMLATISMGLNFVSYLVLIIALIPKVELKKMRSRTLIGFVLMVIINGYLIFRLVYWIRDFSLSSMHFAFIIVSTMALLILAFLVLLYNHTYSTKGSFIFSFFVFLIVFSEVFRALGYYNLAFGDIDVYVARILLIIAMGALVEYSMVIKKNKEHLDTRFF